MRYHPDKEYTGITNVAPSEYKHPSTTIPAGRTVIIEKRIANALVANNANTLEHVDERYADTVKAVVTLGTPGPGDPFIIEDLEAHLMGLGSESETPESGGKVEEVDHVVAPQDRAADPGNGSPSLGGDGQPTTEGTESSEAIVKDVPDGEQPPVEPVTVPEGEQPEDMRSIQTNAEEVPVNDPDKIMAPGHGQTTGTNLPTNAEEVPVEKGEVADGEFPTSQAHHTDGSNPHLDPDKDPEPGKLPDGSVDYTAGGSPKIDPDDAAPSAKKTKADKTGKTEGDNAATVEQVQQVGGDKPE